MCVTLAFKVGIPKFTTHDMLKKGLFKHTRNTIRPIVTDKKRQIGWCTAVALYGTVSILTCWRGWVLTSSSSTERKLQQATSWSLPNMQTQESHQTLQWRKHDRIPRTENGGTGRSALVFCWPDSCEENFQTSTHGNAWDKEFKSGQERVYRDVS
jgi:hypothetical protein